MPPKTTPPADQSQLIPWIKSWLTEPDPAQLEQLFTTADKIRHENVGDEVHLRGLIEIGNNCRRACLYCGLSTHNKSIERYYIPHEECVALAEQARDYGYGTVVVQSGEDDESHSDRIGNLVCAVKRIGLALTLSLGEQPIDDLKTWREKGADRYLLRFETSNPTLYKSIHPSHRQSLHTRFELLSALKEFGYEVGSGVMVGIPGQDWDTLANDIALFHKLDLDMVGIGPFIPHPATPLGKPQRHTIPNQVPATEDAVYRAIALTRILCPQANLPSTTALATINKSEGRVLGLKRGANVVMPNLTPTKYRSKYEVYPDKACSNETAEECAKNLAKQIASIGRTIGKGPGGRVGKRNPPASCK